MTSTTLAVAEQGGEPPPPQEPAPSSPDAIDALAAQISVHEFEPGFGDVGVNYQTQLSLSGGTERHPMA